MFTATHFKELLHVTLNCKDLLWQVSKFPVVFPGWKDFRWIICAATKPWIKPVSSFSHFFELIYTDMTIELGNLQAVLLLLKCWHPFLLLLSGQTSGRQNNSVQSEWTWSKCYIPWNPIYRQGQSNRCKISYITENCCSASATRCFEKVLQTFSIIMFI